MSPKRPTKRRADAISFATTDGRCNYDAPALRHSLHILLSCAAQPKCNQQHLARVKPFPPSPSTLAIRSTWTIPRPGLARPVWRRRELAAWRPSGQAAKSYRDHQASLYLVGLQSSPSSQCSRIKMRVQFARKSRSGAKPNRPCPIDRLGHGRRLWLSRPLRPSDARTDRYGVICSARYRLPTHQAHPQKGCAAARRANGVTAFATN
ncbi:hypothetical protein F4780DRAFT_734180 [Xylariomycetidae sp. FL0641]|nr:hypothetical protein F4780DRAFT_734180 [Xylariomycetidae sp. FL0641]